jgi:hypothetical protein
MEFNLKMKNKKNIYIYIEKCVLYIIIISLNNTISHSAAATSSFSIRIHTHKIINLQKNQYFFFYTLCKNGIEKKKFFLFYMFTTHTHTHTQTHKTTQI